MILVRHAQNMHNARQSDDLNSGLTEKGIWQAEKTGEFLLTLPNIDEYNIVTSPLKRAWQTSSIIAEILGCDISVDWEVREHAHYDSGYPDNIFPLIINSHKDWIYNGYESDDDFYNRLLFVYKQYEHIVIQHDEFSFSKSIIVSHGLAIETLINIHKGISEIPEWTGTCKNCCITSFEHNLEKYTKHLEESV